MADYSLICCVVNMGDGSKTLKFAHKHGVQGGTIIIGRGTVNNRLLGFLGLNDIRKEIVTMVIEQELAAEAIKCISEDMAFDKPNHGIAFSYSVSEFIGHKNPTVKNTNNCEVKNSMYNAIYVIVDKGNAEDVIDAAAKGGARGGTIINARGSGIHETQKLFSIEIEPEKEEVLIIVKSELKDRVVEEIKKETKLEEPGNGILFVLEVNEAYGLHEDE